MKQEMDRKGVIDEDLLKEIHESLRPADGQDSGLRNRLIDRLQAPGIRYRRDRTWRAFRPGIRMQVLNVEESGMVSMLWRVEPGAGIPAHYHDHADECMVLEGRLMVGETELRKGDYLLGRRREWHPAICAPQGALVYVRAHMDAQA